MILAPRARRAIQRTGGCGPEDAREPPPRACVAGAAHSLQLPRGAHLRHDGRKSARCEAEPPERSAAGNASKDLPMPGWRAELALRCPSSPVPIRCSGGCRLRRAARRWPASSSAAAARARATVTTRRDASSRARRRMWLRPATSWRRRAALLLLPWRPCCPTTRRCGGWRTSARALRLRLATPYPTLTCPWRRSAQR